MKSNYFARRFSVILEHLDYCSELFLQNKFFNGISTSASSVVFYYTSYFFEGRNKFERRFVLASIPEFSFYSRFLFANNLPNGFSGIFSSSFNSSFFGQNKLTRSFSSAFVSSGFDKANSFARGF